MYLRRLLLLVLPLFLAPLYAAPQTANSIAASSPTAVPPLIPYSGTVEGISGPVSITFLIFKDETGGEPLFVETQNVAIDPTGHFKVQLGATLSSGLPSDLFSTGEARWLEVQAAGQNPQPRVLLASVPYALKAGDATTLGGLPASAFALAGQAAKTVVAPNGVTPGAVSNVTTTGGTTGYIPQFSGEASIVNSPIFVLGDNVGIGTATPSAPLTVIGNALVTGEINIDGNTLLNGGLAITGNSFYNGPQVLESTGTATATAAFNSQPFKFIASGFNSTSGKAVNSHFLWQSEVTGNNTAAPSATLNLLTSTTSAEPAETGFHFNANGTINFAPGQTFPGGTGTGTITGVTAGTALTGGGTTGNVTLNLDTTKVPLLAASNSFTGNQTITGNLASSGTVTAGIVNATSGFDISGSLFAFGNFPQTRVYLGFAGGPSDTGCCNTGVGSFALANNTVGRGNTAIGTEALLTSTEGYSNTATGSFALQSNATGSYNVANGAAALYSNSTGQGNVASGYFALFHNTAGMENTATGDGALGQNTSGDENTATGAGALGNATGFQNTATGYAALDSNTTGFYNTAIGVSALYHYTTGSNNVGVGAYTGYTVDNSEATGSNNTAVGSKSAFRTGSLTNATAIGAYAEVGDSNTLILGCTAGKNGCPAQVIVGIGTTTPDNLLTVNGTADKPGGGSWGTFSDGRLKTVNGGFADGLNQIMQLHPIRYRYKPDNALGIRDTDEHIGVVAQEVQRVIPEAVTENSKGYLIVNNDPVIWSMVNAIKEQQKEIEAQQKLIREQTQAMKSLVAEVRETRKALRQVKAQAATGQLTMVASK